jgi:hypothetical protein
MINTSNKEIYICIQLELAPDTWLANIVSLVIRRTRFADRIALANRKRDHSGCTLRSATSPH